MGIYRIGEGPRKLLLFVVALTVPGVFAVGESVRRKSSTETLRPGVLQTVMREQTLPFAQRSYCSSIREDMFGTADCERIPYVDPKSIPISTVDMPPPIVVPDPWADQVYVGHVDRNGTKIALIENIKTGVGDFYSIGGEYKGGTVTDITKTEVCYTSGGVERKLAINTGWSLTPLSQNAKNKGDETVRLVENSFALSNFISDDNVIYIGNATGISDLKAKQLQSDVFEGKISHDQAAAQGLGAAYSLPPGLRIDSYHSIVVDSLEVKGASANLR